MKTTNANRTQLQVERLEGRDLLAGNVTVSVLNNSLVINGDGLSNKIQVQQVSRNTFVVAGRDSSTTINRKVGALTFSNVTADVEINLKGGHDNVRVLGTGVGSRLMSVGGSLIIDGGTGDDLIELKYLAAGRDIVVETGSGRNTVGGHAIGARGDLIVRQSAYRSGDTNTVALSYAYADNGGPGIGVLKIDLHNGSDYVFAHYCGGAGIQIDLWGGGDYLSLAGSTFNPTQGTGADSWLDGGSGTDTLNVYGNRTTYGAEMDPHSIRWQTVTNNYVAPPPV